MRCHAPAELARFLRAVDEALVSPVQLVVIGGAAAALHHGATRQTSDIDTFQQIPPELEHAIDLARRRTSLDIPVSFAAIADGPYDFEDRLESAPELGLQRLNVRVPERHDLALMKTIRGYEHDLQVIREMHKKRPLELPTLLDRFEHEMGHVVADPRKLRLNFLLLVDRIYGPRESSRVRRELDLRHPLKDHDLSR